MKDSYHCIICGEQRHDGIFILYSFICSSCETAIVKTRVEDQMYEEYIRKMRRILLQMNP